MTSGEATIRFNDVSASYHEQKAEINTAIAQVLERSDFIGGLAIQDFEQAFAIYTGAKHCIGVSNGTSALHVAMLAAGIEPGDEIITSPMTFIATSEAISLCGATPVFADVNPETLNLDPQAVQAAITPKTRGILFVYLHGNPGGAKEVADIARRNELLFFEDCAQAHGARFEDGSHVGGLGAAAGYSFFPAKNLGAFGDAGAITSTDENIARRARQISNHGRSEKYIHQLEGMNARLDTLQAAVLRVKLRSLDDQVIKRNKLARTYIEGLAELPVKLQSVPKNCLHAWHLFTIHTDRRDELQGRLKKSGIETGIHYPVPLHLQPAYAHMGISPATFPNAENTANCTLSLPMYPQLPASSVERVVAEIRRFF